VTPHSYQSLADNNNIQTKAVFRPGRAAMGKHIRSWCHSIQYHSLKKKKK